MPKTHTLLLFLLHSIFLLAQSQDEYYRIAFYNVENLFHPEDDSLKNDNEFTPTGERYWTYSKYKAKSNRTAKAILSIGEWNAPDIVGLAEIENHTVLQDLTYSAVLRKHNYKIAHFESPDKRGIDVAAIYKSNRVKLLQSKPVSIVDTNDLSFTTRDILYLKTELILVQDTVHIFYCHWPSRYGGQAKSEPKRILAANTLRAICDSLLTENKEAHIIIQGDFNDEWDNLSLNEHLKAKARSNQSADLINLMAEKPVNTGSHRYRGQWSYLDQAIVSRSLLNPNFGLSVLKHEASVVQHSFLLEADEKYPGNKPFRTFIGYKYQEGFSDHLPIYIDLIFSKDKR